MKHKNKLQPFPACGALEIVVIDISRSIPKTPWSSQHLDIINDSYSKLTCPIPIWKIALTSWDFNPHSWILLYGIPITYWPIKVPSLTESSYDVMLFIRA